MDTRPTDYFLRNDIRVVVGKAINKVSIPNNLASFRDFSIRILSLTATTQSMILQQNLGRPSPPLIHLVDLADRSIYLQAFTKQIMQ